MVPTDLLNLVHCRLQQIKQPFSSNFYFGNISVLAVGDFYQIPPVAKKSLLSNNTSLTELWSLFHILELTEVQRQKGDNDFIPLLNRLRLRHKNDPFLQGDEAFLRNHIINKDLAYPFSSLHIAPLHRQLRDHNQFMLMKMSTQETLSTLQAADMCQDKTKKK